MEFDNSFRERQRARQNAQDKYKENCKKNLVNSVKRNFTTTMIGALDKFEKAFGFLWGQNDKDLTDTQEKYREKWEETRTLILDNGNHQMKDAIGRINEHEVERKKFNYNFLTKEQ